MEPWVCAVVLLLIPIAPCLYIAHVAGNYDPFASNDFVPYAEDLTPPEDWTRITIREVGDVWVSPSYLKTLPVFEISPEVAERVRALHERLGEVAPGTVEEGLESLKRHESPEQEVAVWEHVADRWEQEIGHLEKPDLTQSRLLFRALFACSLLGPEPEKLLAQAPELAAIKDLEGICARYPST